MGVLRSFSRPRVSNDNPYSESLFRRVKYRPDYPSRPFASKGEACQWVVSFVDWYNHRHHHSAINLANPTRWSGATRCWNQPAEVWINKPAEEPDPILERPLIQAA